MTRMTSVGQARARQVWGFLVGKRPAWARARIRVPGTLAHLARRSTLKSFWLAARALARGDLRGALAIGPGPWARLALLEFLSVVSWVARRRRPEGLLVTAFLEGRLASGLSPAANYRGYKVARAMEDRGIRWRICPAVPSKYYGVRLLRSRAPRIMVRLQAKLAQSLLKLVRLFQLAWRAPTSQVVYLQRELMDSGSAELEIHARALGRRLVFDFDDAIFASAPWETGDLRRAKIDRILRLADGVICSNEYLAEYARPLARKVVIAPTPVDTELYSPRADRDRANHVISWIGTSLNLTYVRPLLPAISSAIEDVRARTGETWRFKVVCNPLPSAERAELEHAGVEFEAWSASRDVAQFQAADIGIMPLRDEGWSRGKVGFKLLQYLSCGVPVVASPVGFNREIVDTTNGFLCQTDAEWRQALATLMTDAALRRRLGDAGRARVENRFGLAAFADPVSALLKEVAR